MYKFEAKLNGDLLIYHLVIMNATVSYTVHVLPPTASHCQLLCQTLGSESIHVCTVRYLLASCQVIYRPPNLKMAQGRIFRMTLEIPVHSC